MTPLGDATTKPAGNESANASPDKLTGFEFAIVNVSVVVPFTGILGAPNDFAIDGGPTTVSVSVAGAPVPPWFDDGVTLLFFAPRGEPP